MANEQQDQYRDDVLQQQIKNFIYMKKLLQSWNKEGGAYAKLCKKKIRVIKKKKF